MIQFKGRIFKEVFTENQRYLFSKSMRRQLTKHFLAIPSECPRSAMVYGEGSKHWKLTATKLYLKYIKEGARYEINLEWTARRNLANLIENNRWLSNEDYDDPLKLYTLFDEALL